MSTTSKSVTFTALIFVGMAIAIAGVVIVLLGLGGSTVFELTVAGTTIKTTSTGLAVLAVGAAMSAGVAMALPQNVQVFGRSKASMPERLKSFAPLFILLTVAAVILLVISVVF